jgi:formate dehydrogenase subunit delta
MDMNKLVRMANQIATNFDYGQDRDELVASVTDHLRRFWSPDMKRQIVGHLQSGATDLKETAASAVAKLAEGQTDAA